MKVYIIHDLSKGHIICVHELPNMKCEKCEGYNNTYVKYILKEKEHEVSFSKETIRDNKLKDIDI